MIDVTLERESTIYEKNRGILFLERKQTFETFVSVATNPLKKAYLEVKERLASYYLRERKIPDLTIISKPFLDFFFKTFFVSFLAGIGDAFSELKIRGIQNFAEITEELLIPEGAIENFKRKYVLPSERFYELSGEAKKAAWTVTKDTSMTIIRRFKTELEEAIKSGWSIQDFLEEFQSFSSEPHLETILRTNFATFYSYGRMKTFFDPELEGFVVAFQYSAILDERTRETHRRMDGKIYPIDDPIWKEWTPPNGFNCRCMLVPITRGETFRVSKRENIHPDEGFEFSPFPDLVTAIKSTEFVRRQVPSISVPKVLPDSEMEVPEGVKFDETRFREMAERLSEDADIVIDLLKVARSSSSPRFFFYKISSPRLSDRLGELLESQRFAELKTIFSKRLKKEEKVTLMARILEVFRDSWNDSSTGKLSVLLARAVMESFEGDFAIDPVLNFKLSLFDDEYREVKAALKRLTMEIYETTQKILQEDGIEEIILYRGVSLPEDLKEPGLLNIRPGTVREFIWKGRPLESTSKNFGVAHWFGDKAGRKPFLIAYNVPRERVFSISSIFGCESENEFIVIGGEAKCIIVNIEEMDKWTAFMSIKDYLDKKKFQEIRPDWEDISTLRALQSPLNTEWLRITKALRKFLNGQKLTEREEALLKESGLI